MKIKLDIECTPEEARKFFGLPDVEPMQKVLMDQLQAKMSENIAGLDAENMMKTWLPASMKGLDQMQNMFWSAMNGDKSDK
jgi:NOL1/NOP2/fmu family ribosome biogenesis protein